MYRITYRHAKNPIQARMLAGARARMLYEAYARTKTHAELRARILMEACAQMPVEACERMFLMRVLVFLMQLRVFKETHARIYLY